VSVKFRSWSSLRVAKCIIILVSIICFIFPYTNVLYSYSTNERNVCTYSNNICKLSIDSILLIFNSGIPPVLMVLISLFTIHNVNYVNKIHFGHRRDIQLIRILLV
jgi:hypothetical protein